MLETNEYIPVLQKLYNKSLILESPHEFEPVFWFYFKDAVAHLDFTLCILGYNIQSMRNVMNMEYMKWRIDEEKKDGRDRFPAFINWLKANHRENFDKLPTLWREIYDTDSAASYRSFRIAMDPAALKPLPARFFTTCIDELFDKGFLKSLYTDASLGKLYQEFLAE
ncbi:hypothetical protein L1S32_02640 [Methanogenium sp. S4BF]|uniref:hypothetical protein n=1 Tax=Methanogenium sp. S4BF TaxID=1789226 RepID=UPI0024179D44|nr:hypothetical protein [Methanogenium sp. S4BF]WFN35033.1 hypothetical protein L1S32_02640 [Methanogenium sp. S4BF]